MGLGLADIKRLERLADELLVHLLVPNPFLAGGPVLQLDDAFVALVEVLTPVELMQLDVVDGDDLPWRLRTVAQLLVIHTFQRVFGVAEHDRGYLGLWSLRWNL